MKEFKQSKSNLQKAQFFNIDLLSESKKSNLFYSVMIPLQVYPREKR
jgi:hypothetical protein